MGIITAAVMGSICKELAKLLVSTATDSKAASAVASELAGAAGKSLTEMVVPRLVAAYLGPVEDHPEFRNMRDNDRESVRLEVIETIKPALDRAFLGTPPYKSAEIVQRLIELRPQKDLAFGQFTAPAMLYQQSLDASVRTIIKVAERELEWHADNAAAIHAKIDALTEYLHAEAKSQAQILAVLDYLKRSIDYVNAKEFDDRRTFLEVYYRAIRETLDRMELYGLDVQEDNPVRSQRLSVAYISLNLLSQDIGHGEGSRSWEAVLTAMKPGPGSRLLVRGDAGSGKTTLLRWAAVSLTARRDDMSWQKAVDGPRGPVVPPTPHWDGLTNDGVLAWKEHNPWRGKVPLLVVLRECPDGRLPDLDLFPSFVSSAVGTPPPGLVRWLLNEGGALVMFDGLDEVPTGDPAACASKAITDLVKVYGEKGNLFVATSRPVVKDPAWIERLAFREASIAPMKDDERDDLIHKWHQAIAEETTDLKRREEFRSMPAELIQQLNNRPTVARLATVPLLCAMICAQSGPLGAKLPESEFAIINKLAEAMLWVRDRDRAVPKTGTLWDELMEDKRLAVAAHLAHYLISQGKAAVPRDEALQRITHALRFTGCSEAVAQQNALAVLIRMCDRGGIVHAPEKGLVEFAHKVFCEFLSAFQFVEDQDTLFLSEHATEPSPSNVCRFTAGVKNRKYTEELIGRVLDGERNPDERGVIALRMKQAAPTLDPKVQERVKSVEDRLIPPRSRSAATAIAELGDAVVDRLAFVPGMAVAQQILNATALSQIRSPKAMATLAAYASTADNLTLIELLSNAANPMAIPLVRHALIDPDYKSSPSLSSAIRRQITDAAIRQWLVTDVGLNAVTTLDLAETKVTDASLVALAAKDTGLTALSSLNLAKTEVTDAGAAALAAKGSGLKALLCLNLTATQVTDATAVALTAEDSGLKGLTTLILDNTQVGNRAVEALAAHCTGLNTLTKLSLDDTQITDAGAMALAAADSGLRALTSLWINGTQVTNVGIAAILKVHPRLTIYRAR